METQNTPFIDIRNVILSKAPTLRRWVPSFIFSGIKKLIHEEAINRLIRMVGPNRGCVASEIILNDLRVTYDVRGEDHIPEDGVLLFVSNHPLGGLDGIIYVDYFGKRYQDRFRFPVNDVLLHLNMFNNVFVPINKYGSQAREATQLLNEAYQSELPMITFPSGLVSRWQNGRIMDLEWKKSFIQKAVEHRRTIVPVRFDGLNPSFFYRIARWRERLGLKFNYELILLPKALFKSQGQHFTIHIGKPIPYTTFNTTKTSHQWAQWVKQKVYEIQ